MATEGNGVAEKLGRWTLFKWGARNHPGLAAYILVIVMCYIAAFLNKHIASGIIAATVVTVLLCVIFIVTSISVGKANQRLIVCEQKEAPDGK